MALTPKQERFAQLCVTLANYSAAYRQAYDVGPDAKWTTINVEASRLVADPEVAARIRELQDAAAQRSTVPTLAARIQELRELEAANPDEICGIRWVNCRHCRGLNHGYQWAHEAEYMRAIDEAVKDEKKMPTDEGGYGFNPHLEPIKDCPACWGVGERTFHVADTSKLTGGARRLYKGIKVKGNGDIEILLHDQQKATDMLNRIMGAYKDGAGQGAVTPPSDAQKQVVEAPTAEERQRRYLRLVSG